LGVELEFEATRSRSGLHAARRLAVVVGRGGVRVVEDGPMPGRGRYVVGRASRGVVEAAGDEVIVYFDLRRGPRGQVKGRITVYSPSGAPLLEAVLRRRKVRRSRGNPRYAWAVEAAASVVGLSGYIRRYNWGTGE